MRVSMLVLVLALAAFIFLLTYSTLSARGGVIVVYDKPTPGPVSSPLTLVVLHP